MIKYSNIVDPYLDPEKENVYNLFSIYFNNPIMTKIKDINNTSMYAVKNRALLGIEYQYIIAFVHQDKFPILHKEELQHLKWISLQTRTLKDDYKVETHFYIPKRLPGLDKKINLISQDDKKYVYETDYPISITLLPKTKNQYEYTSEGTIVSALETYQTIIMMK